MALALVVVYLASGRLNLAQGEQATVGTYFALVLSSPASPFLAGTALAASWLPGAPWPLGWAIAGAMVLSAALAALLEWAVVRRIPERSPTSAVSVTIGLLLLLNALTKRVWKPVNRGFKSPFPDKPSSYVYLLGARLRYTTIGTWATLLVLLGLLWLILRFSKAGLAFRAVSSSRANSQLMGIRVGRVLSGGWALAGGLGALCGSLLASRLILSPDMMVRLLVYSFAGATLGGLASMGGALVGGLIVGLAQTMLGGYVPFIGPALSLPAVLLIMIVVLWLRPTGLFGGPSTSRVTDEWVWGGTAAAPPQGRWKLARGGPTWRGMRLAFVALGLVAAVVPAFSFPYIPSRLWTELIAYVVILWGLTLLMGAAGQLSLGQGAFVGLGAYATGIMVGRYGWPSWLAVILAALIGFGVGCVYGLPALRIKGQYLAMVTLSLAIVFPMIVQRFASFTGGTGGPRPGPDIKAPSWFPVPVGHEHVWLHVLVVVAGVAVLVLVRNLLQSSVGRAVKATAQGDTAAAAMGAKVVRIRTTTFGVAAMLGTFGGGLLAVHTRAVTTERFDLFLSLILYAAVVFGGVQSMAGSVIGALLIVGVPWVNQAQGWKVSPNLFFGLLILIGTALFPEGLAPTLGRQLRKLVEIVESPPEPVGGGPSPSPGGPTQERLAAPTPAAGTH